MPTTGDIWASNATNDASVGEKAWSNITNLNGNTTSTSASLTGALAQTNSNYVLTDHVHGLTASDTITGIATAIERKCDNVDDYGRDNYLYLRINGTLQANNKASASNWPTTKQWSVTYGFAPIAYWGAASNPTGADAIGFAFAANCGGKHSQIDVYRMTCVFTYTAASGSIRRTTMMFGWGWFALKTYISVGAFNAFQALKDVLVGRKPDLRFLGFVS